MDFVISYIGRNRVRSWRGSWSWARRSGRLPFCYFGQSVELLLMEVFRLRERGRDERSMTRSPSPEPTRKRY